MSFFRIIVVRNPPHKDLLSVLWQRTATYIFLTILSFFLSLLALGTIVAVELVSDEHKDLIPIEEDPWMLAPLSFFLIGIVLFVLHDFTYRKLNPLMDKELAALQDITPGNKKAL